MSDRRDKDDDDNNNKDKDKDKDKDKKRFVQQYVNRQRAYLPTYTAEDLFNESHQLHAEHGTTRGDDGFGFDTPVLRPRVPRAKNDRAQSPPRRVRALRLAGPSESLREHEAERGRMRASPGEEPSESDTRDLKKQKKRSKPKEPSTPIGDTDDERTARLADRRERKRKKRAIVDPQGKQEDDRIVSTTASKKGKASSQKIKKPAALALLYGFSATNVTKDRLTLRPAPALGVFSKGKASTKKKVSTARKPCTYPVDVAENAVLNEDSAARNESFSETAFLNKSNERAADLSNTHDSDDSLAPDQPIPKEIRKTKRTKKDSKCTEALKTSQAPTRTIAESDIWDIEMQSKLPSSVGDVSSELGVAVSAPVVLDVRGVEWSASLDVGGELKQERRNQTRTPNLSISHSPPRQRYVDLRSPFVRDEGRHVVQDAYTSSIHPSHSASQVGCCVADSQPRAAVPSKYFAIAKPIPAQECPTHAPQLSRSNDDPKIHNLHRGMPLYSPPVLAQELAANATQLSRSNVDVQLDDPRSRTPMCFPEELESVSVGVNPQSLKSNCVPGLEIPDLGANPMVDLQTIHGAASSINSLTSVLQPMVTFQTPYDMVGLDLTGLSSPYDDYYGRIDTPRDLPGGQDQSHFERSVVESVSGLEQDLESHDPDRGDTLGYWYRSPAGLATYDVGFADTDPLAPEYQADELRSFAEALDEDDPAEGQWIQMDETEQDFAGHEDETTGSIYYSDEQAGLDEPDEDVVDFLEGRALLLGVPMERRRYVGMTALVQAEMDVANRLRDHWRPLRL